MSVANSRRQIVEPADAAIRVDRIGRDGILGLGDEWSDLTRNCLEENAYYSPRYVRSLLNFVDKNPGLNALVAYKNDRLIGFLPNMVDRWRWPGFTNASIAWTTDYSPSSTPLIHEAHAEEAIGALLNAMAGDPRSSRFWLFPDSNTNGPVATTFKKVLGERHLPWAAINLFDRPILGAGSNFDTYMKKVVSSKRRRELKRSRKRLSELGEVSFRSFTHGDGLNEAVADFLRIEKSGWKGGRGTAMDSVEGGREFIQTAFASGDSDSIGRADVLYLNDTAIAVSLALQTGRVAFTIKCAFDERYRGMGVGLLLEEDVIRDVLTHRWADQLDSATQSSHVIQSLWNNTASVGDFLICVDGKTVAGFQRWVTYERSRHVIRESAKKLWRMSRVLVWVPALIEVSLCYEGLFALNGLMEAFFHSGEHLATRKAAAALA